MQNWTESCPEGTPGSAYVIPCEVSVDELNNSAALEVFPNPADEFIYVIIPGDVMIQNVVFTVYNMEGRSIRTTNNIGENNISVDISSLQSGMYFIEIKSGNNILNAKFMKE